MDEDAGNNLIDELVSKLRNSAFQEDRARNCQEILEFPVNRFMIQVRELQHMVNSLNDAKEFFDPETASSSGYPSFPVNP